MIMACMLIILVAVAITVTIETMTVGLAGVFGSAVSWITLALAILFITNPIKEELE